MSSEPEPDAVEVRCYFVRERNALAVRAQVSPLFVDYYLHLAEHDLRPAPAHDAMLKEALAAMVLHLASRPWTERHAWTFNFQEPLLNLFVTGDNATSQVTGRSFTANVKRGAQSLMYSQLQTPRVPVRQSAIEIAGTNLYRCVEDFYVQSEQRRARFFFHGEEDIVFITAQPQCDVEWLETLTDEGVRNLDQNHTLSLLETRQYKWGCGCTAQRLCEVMAPHAKNGLDALYGDDSSLTATCPRCGAVYQIGKKDFATWLAERKEE